MNALEIFLDQLKKNREGGNTGVYSVCSSQENVIRASIAQAAVEGALVLVESTSNQVDQNGGYTGMKPKDYVAYVRGLASEMKFPADRVLLGGDHLGPNVWQGLNAQEAMANSHVLVSEYVKAGYQKIHLDASMFLADDKGDRHKPLADEVVAERAAALCKTSETAWKETKPTAQPPVYIIGTEVPIPGGAQDAEEVIHPTSPEDAIRTVEITKAAFMKAGLEDAWTRVVGTVVQPGVEFGDDQVADYNPESAKALSKKIEGVPGLVYEAHSTDYQTEAGLTALVRDHFCILKVGPWLTFAYREGLYALEMIEQEVMRGQGGELSNLRKTLEDVMMANTKYWKKYYPGNDAQQAFKRAFSFSDRSRYYWPDDKLRKAKDKLFSNLRKQPVPLSLLSQYLPEEYCRVREGKVKNDPEALVASKITTVLGIYSRACGLS